MDNSQQKVETQLEQFVNNILAQKDLSGIDPDVREQMRCGLLSRIEDRINAALLENMPADKLDDFEKVLMGDRPEEIHKFCQENIPNLDEIVAKELVDFEASYLSH